MAAYRTGLGRAVCGVALGCVLVLMGASMASAGPVPGHFEYLGGKWMNLGAGDERSPSPVMHGGRPLVGVILADRGREQMVVSRLAADGSHWDRLGMPLNHDLGNRVSQPRLLSTGDPRRGGALYAIWVEAGRLMIAQLHDEAGDVRWRPFPPGPPVDERYRELQVVALHGRPTVVYASPTAWSSIALLTDDGRWRDMSLARFVPVGTQLTPGAAVYTNSLYLPYRHAQDVPAHQGEDGKVVPAHRERGMAILRLRLNVDGQFEDAGVIRLRPLGRHFHLVIVDQQGARPLLLWSDHGNDVIAQLNLAGDDVTIVSRALPGTSVLAATRLGDSIGLLVERGGAIGSLALYRLAGTPGDTYWVRNTIHLSYLLDLSQLTRIAPRLIAGPDNLPLVTLSANGGAMAMVLTPNT